MAFRPKDLHALDRNQTACRASKLVQRRHMAIWACSRCCAAGVGVRARAPHRRRGPVAGTLAVPGACGGGSLAGPGQGLGRAPLR